MSEPSTAPYVATRLLDVPVGSDDGEGTFHLVRHHLGVRAFGVNGARADAGQLVITPHDERDDTDYGTEGHEELFVVLAGHAAFTIGDDAVDAPAGTLVFVRDPALVRSARAVVDGTEILAVGARPGAAFAVSRWEQALVDEA